MTQSAVNVCVVGLNHHSAPVEIRERLAFESSAAAAAMRSLLLLPEVEEGLVVSTCNRVEVVAAGRDGLLGTAALAGFLAREKQTDERDMVPHLYAHQGKAALRHMFRVASSLDSLVVGEPQILGQIKQFYAIASEQQTIGRVLHRAFHKSFSVAKRVRTETGIGAGGVSVASVAVDLATQIFESFGEKSAMVIGAGEMAELVAQHLQGNGIGSLLFANRTFDRAVALARQFRGTPVPIEEIGRYLPLADVVVGSTAAETFVLGRDAVESAQRERKWRPMFLIDLSVPRNFDPAANEVDGVYLYDIDDLEGVIEKNRDAREREAMRAEEIVEAEVESFWGWLQHLEVEPTIRAIHERAHSIRERELARTLESLPDLDERSRRAIETMAQSMVNKILHSPIRRLKQPGEDIADDVRAARRLFSIDDDD